MNSSLIRPAITATVLKYEDVMFNEAIIMLFVNPNVTIDVMRANSKIDRYFFIILVKPLTKNSETAIQKTGWIPMRLIIFVKPIR